MEFNQITNRDIETIHINVGVMACEIQTLREIIAERDNRIEMLQQQVTHLAAKLVEKEQATPKKPPLKIDKKKKDGEPE